MELVRIDHYTDPVFIRRLIDSLRPGDIFYDVGANIGVISLAAGIARPSATIHAFEP
jgi:precorrin-6B methylase 2